MVVWLKNNYHGMLQVIIYIVLLLIIVEVLGPKGFIGVITGVILYLSYRLYIGRKDIMMGVRHIEIMIFGKPLDKEYWKKGEKPIWKKQK